MDLSSSQTLLDSDLDMTCQPIRTYEELLEFVKNPPSWRSLCNKLTPHSKNVIKNNEIHNQETSEPKDDPKFFCHFDIEQKVAIKYHEEERVPKTLVCHDMANGYHDDSFIDGTVNYDAYNFYNWGGIDIFCYFSHHFVTVPPLGWINVAHAHGVKVIGTVITEWSAGAAFWERVLSAEAEWRRFASALLAVAQCLRLDGWLLNVENEISKPEALLSFVQELSRLQRSELPDGGLLIWYDSVTVNGKLSWQNKLNHQNKAFFDACDGIFTNYSWSEADVRASAVEAGDRLRDVYIGIDVWGRNFYGGGKFNTRKAVEVAHKYGCSLAIFAPAWTHETLSARAGGTSEGSRYSEFLLRDRALWDSIWHYLNTKLPRHLPFHTSFCRGQGQKRRLYGEVLSPGPWYNFRHMQYQPNSAHGPHQYELVTELVAAPEPLPKDDKKRPVDVRESVSLVVVPAGLPCYELYSDDSFTGGSCLKVYPSGEGELVSLLFQCDFRWRHTLLVCVATKARPLDVWLWARGPRGERRYVLAGAARPSVRGLSLDTERLAPLEGSALTDVRRHLLLEEPTSYVPLHNAYGWNVKYYAVDVGSAESVLTQIGCCAVDGPALLGYFGLSEILSFGQQTEYTSNEI